MTVHSRCILRCVFRLRGVLALVALIASSLPVRAEDGSGFWEACPGSPVFEPGSSLNQDVIPGVSWDGWRTLLHADWSANEIRQPGWFNGDSLIRAVNTVPDQKVDQPDRFWSRTPLRYRALVETPDDFAAYDSAASLFDKAQWSAAVAAFDAISRSGSPFRAAAPTRQLVLH